MDRSRTADEHCIRRIVAVLLALADLAERAAGRPIAVRCLVLWLLRSGAVLARDHLAGLTRDAAWPGQPVLSAGYSATEAIRLATTFRHLAAALTAFAAENLASPQQAATAPRGLLFGQFAAADSFPAPHASTLAVGRLDSS